MPFSFIPMVSSYDKGKALRTGLAPVLTIQLEEILIMLFSRFGICACLAK